MASNWQKSGPIELGGVQQLLQAAIILDKLSDAG